MSYAYAIANKLAGLSASAFTWATGPSDATRLYLNDGSMEAQMVCGSRASNNSVVIDLGSAMSIAGVAILNSNIAEASVPTMLIEAADNSAITTNAVTPKSGTTLNLSAPNQKEHVLQFSAVSKRYWRITWGWGGSFNLKVGEIFLYAAPTVFTRTAVYGGLSEEEEIITADSQGQNGAHRAAFIAGPIREKRFAFADWTESEKNELFTFWRATRGPVTPALFIQSYETGSAAAAVAQQECLFGKFEKARLKWNLTDFTIYGTDEMVLRSLSREVGS